TSVHRKVKFIDYSYWYNIEKKEIDAILQDCLSRGQLLLRDEVESFERNLAKYVGTKYAVATSNCTDSLRLSLTAAGIGPGDEVITSAHTFAATVAAIEQVGATPVLADIKSDDHLIDIESVKRLIASKTKCIIPVSLNGRVADLEEIEDLAADHEILLIEDAAQGLGGYRNGRMAGSFGMAGCFSFYPAKTLGALGDAGAITTNSEDIYNKLIALRNHNRTSDGDIKKWGFNCRLDNIQAAVLDFRLSRLENYIQKRRHIASIYHEGLKNVEEIILPPNDRNDTGNRDAYQNFEFEAKDRDNLLNYLRSEGVEIILPWGGKAIHQFSAYHGDSSHLWITNRIFDRIMTLPMHIALTDEDVEYTIDTVNRFYHR
ncbi:MAG: aminotransferase class I/II-fold pyridoxal phosphate-dependent enzyme, partial [candidate division Zixibacteria bacterium]|nr:aminotransferase class I/II-fold pyridoxal phosphate-dependent enzyme [candidate division Zixibacteria bacterium]